MQTFQKETQTKDIDNGFYVVVLRGDQVIDGDVLPELQQGDQILFIQHPDDIDAQPAAQSSLLSA